MADYQEYFDYDEEDEIKEVRTFLEFVISGKVFAIETFEVVEIVQMDEITPVPEFPEYVKGLMTAKGRTVAVIDTAKRFKYDAQENSLRQCVVICKTQGEKEIGIMADNVLKIKDVECEKISPSPSINREAFTRYITGMYLKSNDEPCFIVSPQLMMSEDEQQTILG